jgi:hypothetical protein
MSDELMRCVYEWCSARFHVTNDPQPLPETSKVNPAVSSLNTIIAISPFLTVRVHLLMADMASPENETTNVYVISNCHNSPVARQVENTRKDKS